MRENMTFSSLDALDKPIGAFLTRLQNNGDKMNVVFSSQSRSSQALLELVSPPSFCATPRATQGQSMVTNLAHPALTTSLTSDGLDILLPLLSHPLAMNTFQYSSSANGSQQPHLSTSDETNVDLSVFEDWQRRFEIAGALDDFVQYIFSLPAEPSPEGWTWTDTMLGEHLDYILNGRMMEHANTTHSNTMLANSYSITQQAPSHSNAAGETVSLPYTTNVIPCLNHDHIAPFPEVFHDQSQHINPSNEPYNGSHVSTAADFTTDSEHTPSTTGIPSLTSRQYSSSNLPLYPQESMILPTSTTQPESLSTSLRSSSHSNCQDSTDGISITAPTKTTQAAARSKGVKAKSVRPEPYNRNEEVLPRKRPGEHEPDFMLVREPDRGDQCHWVVEVDQHQNPIHLCGEFFTSTEGAKDHLLSHRNVDYDQNDGVQFDATGARTIRCGWLGCDMTVQSKFFSRHVSSVHLGIKVLCLRCGDTLKRIDEEKRHRKVRCQKMIMRNQHVTPHALEEALSKYRVSLAPPQETLAPIFTQRD
ncbi:hypothetical protein F5878DRAFT_725943 [Lentinula raphanica]|uniref:Uncharacterized protein n=1 Tax=Lentinula raphanica TaxID=153919 RepID=A0AA38P798_9AGAR|nr:hypothetical protein F5878DRAFT_725943 [Lentinula raphanica]